MDVIVLDEDSDSCGGVGHGSNGMGVDPPGHATTLGAFGDMVCLFVV